jgi:hypothetical protein
MIKKKKSQTKDEDESKFPGYPHYSEKEDIFSKEKKLPLAEENPTPIGDEDVPGSELDDADEAIGEEDEENNYYSLGGDDHNDLTEDQGDD